MDNIVDENMIIIEKSHFVDLEIRNISNNIEFSNNNIIKCPSDMDVQELLLISDILITDYSSCYIYYLILDRPIIHCI